MGYNELLLLASSLLSVALVLAAWKLDRERLHSAILVFLILIAIAGGKIVEFFGFATNTGNIFYASVFLATYFLIEHHGKREGIRSIWIGTLGVVAFSILLSTALALSSDESTAQLSTLLSSAYVAIPRFAFASLIAYIASQTLNVFLYIHLKKRYGNGDFKRMWLRVNASNVLAQFVDSVVFFSIAFWGTIHPSGIWEILIVGFVIKVVFVAIFSPLLHFNRIEKEEGEKFSTMVIR